MYHILDGTDSSDYIQRMKPSSTGGQKLAKAFFDVLM